MNARSPSLDTLGSCLGPELLRAALTDVAPSATRQRVCQAIDSSLEEARTHAPDSMRSTAGASCRVTTGAAALSVGIPRDAINPARDAINPARATPLPMCLPPLRRRFGRFLPAIQLAAAVAVGVGSAAGARVLRAPEVVPEAAAMISPSGTNSVSNALVMEASPGKLGRSAAMNGKTLRARRPHLAPERVPSADEKPADDWLGAQLSILSQAERSLRDGKPEQAMKSLERYAALFPMGLLDPQVTSLRQRAQLREERQVFIFP